MIRLLFAVLLLSLTLPVLALPARAQDIEGNNRPSNWRVKFFEPHGIWTAICDEREEAGALRQRCYIRYVDVFSPAPQFAAQFVFLTPEADGLQVDFGMEPGTLFAPDGFRIVQNGAVVWQTRRPGCLTGLGCTFRGDAATRLIDRMKIGGDFRFTFIDRHGSAQDLTWPLMGFTAALEDFIEQSQLRGLM